MRHTYAMNACVISNIGKRRTNHEDNFLLNDGQYISQEEQEKLSDRNEGWKSNLIRQSSDKGLSSALFAVSDGMGGHNAGEVASRIAVEQLSGMREYLFRTPDAASIASRVQDYVMKANTVITMKAHQNAELSGMSATLTGIILCEQGVIPFNLGDSRTYSFDGQLLKKVSKDHTEGQRLVDFGMIKEEEKHLVDGGKAITRYLGMDDKNISPQAEILDILTIEKRVYFLLCSDGLTDLVSDKEIEEVLKTSLESKRDSFLEPKSLLRASELLVQKALAEKDGQQGGIDNITVMLVCIEEYVPTLLDAAVRQIQKIKDRLK